LFMSLGSLKPDYTPASALASARSSGLLAGDLLGFDDSLQARHALCRPVVESYVKSERGLRAVDKAQLDINL
jgi:hypothetical protein